jgi:hypothetical protein
MEIEYIKMKHGIKRPILQLIVDDDDEDPPQKEQLLPRVSEKS